MVLPETQGIQDLLVLPGEGEAEVVAERFFQLPLERPLIMLAVEVLQGPQETPE